MRGVRVASVCLMAFISFFAMAQDQTNVVTLSQCIDEAMKNGPDIRLSQTNLASSQSQYSQSVAQNSFNLKGTASASRTQPFVNTVRGQTGENPFNPNEPILIGTDKAQASVTAAGPSTNVGLSLGYGIEEDTPLVHSTTLGLSAGQTIWDGYAGGLAKAAVQQAGLSLQQAQLTNDSAVKTAVYNVKQAYYTMLSQQRQLKVLQDTLTQRQAELARVQALMANQDATIIDLQQAQVNLQTAQLNLTSAQQALEIDRENLSALIGRPLDSPYTVADVEDQPVPSLDVNAAIQKALSQRTDLATLRLKRTAGNISLAQTKAQYSPTVSASAGIDWTRDWTNNTDLANWSAGVSVSVPIVDSGLTDQQVKQDQLQNQSLDIQIQQSVADISTSVKNAVYSVQNLLAQADLAQKSLQLAQSQYDLAKAQFDTGVIATQDLLAASVTLSSAQAAAAVAKSNVQLGVLALQNAIGE